MKRIEKIGQIIRETRQEKGINIQDLATAIGISKVYMQDIENGFRIPPSEETCEKISEILGIEISYEEYKKASWEDSREAWNNNRENIRETLLNTTGVSCVPGATEEEMHEFISHIIEINDKYFAQETKEEN